jgi:ankyrin repeat protein
MAEPSRDAELLVAIQDGDAPRVAALLEAGASPDARGGFPERPAIVAAAEGDRLAILEALLVAGATPDEATRRGDTALMQAARAGRLDMVRALLARGASVDKVGKEGTTALQWAAWGCRRRSGEPTRPGYAEVIRVLIEAGASLDGAGGIWKATALFLAASLGDASIVRALLEAGADPTIRNGDGVAPIARAASRGFADIVDTLAPSSADAAWISAIARHDAAALAAWVLGGGDPNVVDESGLSPLGLAAPLGDAGAVEALLAAGASADQVCLGEAPLLSAARLGHAEAGVRLARVARELEVADHEGDTALVHAARRGATPLVAELLARGARIEGRKGRVTPLQCAVGQSHVDAALVLIDAGADPAPSVGEPVMATAARTGQSRVIERLVAKGVDVQRHAGFALFWAAFYGWEETARTLLSAGADPDSRGPERETPLFGAAQKGHEALAMALLEAGAKIDAHTNGRTALVEAAACGHTALVRRLLEAGAGLRTKRKLVTAVAAGDAAGVAGILKMGEDANSADGIAGWSALTWAALLGHEVIAQVLLAAGADPAHIAKQHPPTALLAAAANGHAGIVRLLMKAGVASKEPRAGVAALLAAAGAGQSETVRALVESGVDANTRGEHESTALFGAAEGGHTETVETLLVLGADPTSKVRLHGTAADAAAVKGHLPLAERLRDEQRAWLSRTPSVASDLIAAVIAGDRARVAAALAAGADPNRQDAAGSSAAQLAVKRGDVEIVRALVQAGADAAPLLGVVSLKAATLDLVRFLLDAGADVNLPMAPRAPLAWAALAGRADLLALLLERGAKVDEARGPSGETALATACANGHESVVKMLLRAGADPRRGTPLRSALIGRFPDIARMLLIATLPEGRAGELLRAVAEGDAERTRSLLAAGTPATTGEPETKWPALLLACFWGAVNCARALLAAGADANAGRDRWTPLALALVAHDETLTEALLARGADPNGSMERGPKLLLFAISEGLTGIVDRLLAAGARPTTPIHGGKAIHLAASLGSTPSLKALLHAGAGIETKDDRGRTPLVRAVKGNRALAVAAFIEAGADVGVRWDGKTVLHWAAESGRRECLELLLRAGASAVTAAEDGRTPLHAAALRGDEAAVARLLAAGAVPGAQDASGLTAVVDAARAGHLGIVSRLLAAGAPADDASADVAAEEGEIEIVAALARHGSARAARIQALVDGTADAVEPPPMSTVMLAARTGRRDLLSRLLALKPKGDATPALELARREGFHDIARLLGGDGTPLPPNPRGSESNLAERSGAELPSVYVGAFATFHRSEPEGFAKGVAAYHFTDGDGEMGPFTGDIDAEMAELGYAHLGDIYCDRMKSLAVRGYGSSAVGTWGEWLIGVFRAVREFFTHFEDGAGLTTTTSDKAGDPGRRAYARCLPGASMWVLHHKHMQRVAWHEARGARRLDVEASLSGLAAALDRSLVRQFRT